MFYCKMKAKMRCEIFYSIFVKSDKLKARKVSANGINIDKWDG